jgi:hypothetical protein
MVCLNDISVGANLVTSSHTTPLRRRYKSSESTLNISSGLIDPISLALCSI